MRIEGDNVIFSTGKVLTANCGVIGLSHDGSVSEGWDGGFFNPEDDEPSLTPTECRELAQYMMIRWLELGMKYAE